MSASKSWVQQAAALLREDLGDDRALFVVKHLNTLPHANVSVRTTLVRLIAALKGT